MTSLTSLKGLLIVMVLMSVMLTSTAKFSDMKSAFDAAFVRLVADGTYSQLSSGDNTSLTVSDCTATPSFYPYPAAPTGTLKSVLDRKVVNLGTLYDDGNFFSAAAGVQPSGWGSTLVLRIFSLIGANYGVSLTVNWVYFDTSPDAFDALVKGQVDLAAPDFSLGAFYNGSRRTEVFEPTCTLVASSTSVWAKTGVFASLSALKSAAMTRSLKVGTGGEGSRALAVSFFPTASVTDVTLNVSLPADQTTQFLFDQLKSGAFDILFDTDPETADQSAGVMRIDSELIAGAGGFFRTREQEQQAAGCSTGGGNTININFAGILSGR